MNIFRILLAGLLVLPLAATAQRDDLNYTWLEVMYLYLDIDELGSNDSISDWDDGDGFEISGSYGFDNSPFDFIETWFIFANYSETENDVDFRDDFGIRRPADTDIIRFDLGVGAAMPLNDWSHIVARIAYSDIDIDDFNFGGTDSSSISDLNDDDSDGFFVDAAWRGQVTPMIELTGGLRYTDIEDTDQVSFIGRALFEINQSWGITVGTEVGDELTSIGAGVRYTWR